MAKEVSWQKKLVDKVKAEGGYGHKRSHAYLTGVVDLMLIHRLFGTVFVEAKLLKPANRDKFNLTMGFTETQKEEGSKIRMAGGVAIGLAFVYFKPTDVHLVLTPLPTPRGVVRVCADDMARHGWKWRKTGSSVTEWIADNYRRVQSG